LLVDSHFAESLHGLVTIRAFNQVDRFKRANQDRLDTYVRCLIAETEIHRWMSLRLELLGTVLLGTASLVLCILRSSIPTSLIALALVYATEIPEVTSMLAMNFAEAEAQFNCIERILHYSTSIPQEIENKNKYVNSAETRQRRRKQERKNKSKMNNHVVSSDGYQRNQSDLDGNQQAVAIWPWSGAISFHNYSMRYRAELPLVLDSLNIEIKAGEKIGIIGRTGAGKSSIVC